MPRYHSHDGRCGCCSDWGCNDRASAISYTIGSLIDQDLRAFLYCPDCDETSDIDLYKVADEVGRDWKFVVPAGQFNPVREPARRGEDRAREVQVLNPFGYGATQRITVCLW